MRKLLLVTAVGCVLLLPDPNGARRVCTAYLP